MSTLGVIGFAILWGWEARGQDAPERPQGSAPRGQVSGELNFANGLFRDRRYELAAEEYERFLKGAGPGPDADAARFGLASSRLFQGRYAEARRHFEDFVKAAPGHANAPTAWYRIGEAAYMLGDWPAARQALETFTAGNPEHRYLETAWPYLGDICFRLGDLAQARRAYERSLELHPKGRLANRARFGLGRTLAQARRPGRGPEGLDGPGPGRRPRLVGQGLVPGRADPGREGPVRRGGRGLRDAGTRRPSRARRSPRRG